MTLFQAACLLALLNLFAWIFYTLYRAGVPVYFTNRKSKEEPSRERLIASVWGVHVGMTAALGAFLAMDSAGFGIGVLLVGPIGMAGFAGTHWLVLRLFRKDKKPLAARSGRSH